MALARVMVQNLSRMFLFAYNTRTNGSKTANWKMPDFTGFDILAMQLRGFGKASWLAWPLLVVLDIQNLVGVVLDRFQEDDDVISMVMKYQVSRDFVPTPTSWLTSKLMDKEQVTAKLKQYWCGWRSQPRMFELMSKHLNEV